ncbi:MAG TPA: hypothetical protein VJR03_08755 [Nitrospira sp.]|nr:hypothetical protein [Nitrospira sp.]
MTTYFLFKLGLLVFWGFWYVIAFSTNLCELFRALRVLPWMWPFASGNLRDVTQAAKTYSRGGWLSRLLFFGVLSFQLLIVCLFGWGGHLLHDRRIDERRSHQCRILCKYGFMDGLYARR